MILDPDLDDEDGDGDVSEAADVALVDWLVGLS